MLRRRFQHKEVYFIGTRLIRGLPFVPNGYVNSLIYGILARAGRMYPDIGLCAAVFMQNHYHLIVVLKGDPAELSNYMNFINGELGKTLAKMLKRSGKFWDSPYVAIKLCDPAAVVKELAYLFLNPVAANLVETPSDWCGVTTWQSLFENRQMSYRWVHPRLVQRLPDARFTRKGVQALEDQLAALRMPPIPLNLDPFAWKQAFVESTMWSNQRIIHELLQIIEMETRRHRMARKNFNRSLPDRDRLELQNPYKKYKPSKFAPAVYCIATDPEIRRRWLDSYKEFCAKCAAVWNRWKNGELDVPYPPGAFAPPRKPRANIWPLLT